MEDYKKTELLVQVAKLYYEHDYSQSQIAEKLKLSRPYISKLLQDAKTQGIVVIQVLDPVQAETQLERALRQKFQLRKVVVVPETHGQNVLAKLGLAGARYLDSIIRSEDIVGFSWGATLYSCSQNAIVRNNLADVTTVQLCGGISNLEKNTYAVEISKNFAIAFSGTPYILPVPAVVDDIRVKNSMLKDTNVKSVMDFGKQANIAMFTMGAFGADSALAHTGYLNAAQLQSLEKAGAVGDICTHIIDIHGNLCDQELDSRTIAVPLEDIKKKEYRIGIAAGAHKVDCICGALASQLVNVLIVDEATAQNVLERLDTIPL